jgi:type I restriction-modification system DNA methylase subunit
MNFPSIMNRGEFFSAHYLEAVIAGDLSDLRSQWDSLEGKDMPTARFGVRSMRTPFFAARALAAEAKSPTDSVHGLHDVVLAALGFEVERQQIELVRNTTDVVEVPIAAQMHTSTGLLLVAIEAGMADSLEDILDTSEKAEPGRLTTRVFRQADKKAVNRVQPAVNEIFSVDEPPRFVVVAAGRFVILAERAKWAEGRFLAVDLDAALERNDTKAKGELETIAALFSADALRPGGPAANEDESGGQSILDELTDKSQKHAVGVSKELRHGIRHSIELLANEVVEQRLNAGKAVYSGNDAIDANDLTRQSLRWLYRLVVLLYAESRPELGVLPVNDEAYLAGYSLDRLRELTLVDLDTERSRNGSHLHESLDLLFELVNTGRHDDQAQTMLALFDQQEDAQPTTEQYLQLPGLDAALFAPSATPLLNSVTLRNETLQQVLKMLTYTEGKGKNGTAGFISYAQLGINQLGAVYEGLMAYSGFFADEPLYEVAKGGDPEGGTWMLPVDKADEYPDEVFVTTTDERTGAKERVRHEKSSFVFRLSGRDRQRSASYYTPEVLTRCVVKHALAELLGLDDYAPENGSMGITSAAEILDITICEPALGSGAFANEAINQLAAEYLRRAQAEQGENLDPERYRLELQKVKAHFALHQTYGVDLNATAVELAEVSLWLNAMYPGLQAPWFGLQLRQGNSLIGCRRATWTASQIQDKPWANTKKGQVKPPEDRKLNVALNPDEIHHFLFPGHGWAAGADRKEAKELRPDEVAELKQWRKTILAAPKKADAVRLGELAAGVEAMWQAAADQIAWVQNKLRRNMDLYGIDDDHVSEFTIGRDDAEQLFRDADAPLGRLRTLMDAWTGLWFWPLDSGVKPPTWNEWLKVAEELIQPDERHGLTGQLDLFADLETIQIAEAKRRDGHASVEELRATHVWLDVALEAAQREAAWHWDLEFAPVFKAGGFDLQVGNPPWVRLDWEDDLTLAETDPWWGVADKPSAAEQKQRRLDQLASHDAQLSYLAEVAASEGVVEVLGSSVLRAVLSGLRTNLYMVFMDTAWRHLADRGSVGLLHPESHFTDPKAAGLRRATYGRLRRHWQFQNALFLFEEIHDMNVYGIHVYCSPMQRIRFAQAGNLFHPDVLDRSIDHDGAGFGPGIQYPEGGWDLRPHRSRVLTIDEQVLADWTKLFDEPGTPAAEARLLRPVTTADLEALSVLADQPTRLADHDYHWTQGWNETNAKSDGTIRWETNVPDSWDDVVLQGPHFTIATPFAKQPNENCKHNQDYSDWDLETLPEHVIPRTNYQRACDRSTYDSRLDVWDGDPYTSLWRVAFREMTQPGLERSLHPTLIPPGPSNVGTVISMAPGDLAFTALWSGLLSTLPYDYFVKVSGTGHIKDYVSRRMPVPDDLRLAPAILLRALRLNCLTAGYSSIWNQLFDQAWETESWTDSSAVPGRLGIKASGWSASAPLRRDAERRMALVELDALASLMLGLSAEQLCAMYRTQFAVLRKYEYKMVFDAKGRKICGYHQSAGYRQAELQEQAKAGELPKEWKNLWKLYEQYEEDPDSVDWLGRYTAPFRRADREAEMTHAYNEFQRRLDAGEYDS